MHKQNVIRSRGFPIELKQAVNWSIRLRESASLPPVV